MTWFRVDDALHSHRKAVRAGVPAMGLWVMAGSWCADHLTDGFIPDYMAARIDRDFEQNAARLVDVGLWEPIEKGGDKGWQFHEWTDQQPTREEVKAAEAKKSTGGKIGNHRRWHVEAGKSDPKCPYCRSDRPAQASSTDRSTDRLSDRSTDRTTESGAIPPTRPDPTRPETSYGSLDSSSGDEDAQPAIAGMPDPPPAQKRRTAKAAPKKTEPGEETQGQRVNRVTRTYTDVVKLADFMGVQQVTKTALTCGDYAEQQVIDGLKVLADKRDPVTRNSLRIAIEGLPSWAKANEQDARNGGMGSYQRPGKHTPFQNPADISAYHGDL